MIENYVPNRGLRDTLYLTICTDREEGTHPSRFGYQAATIFTADATLTETKDSDPGDPVALDHFKLAVYRDGETHCGYDLEDEEWAEERRNAITATISERNKFVNRCVSTSLTFAFNHGYTHVLFDLDGEETLLNTDDIYPAPRKGPGGNGVTLTLPKGPHVGKSSNAARAKVVMLPRPPATKQEPFLALNPQVTKRKAEVTELKRMYALS